jgi:chondroitin AC lyase
MSLSRLLLSAALALPLLSVQAPASENTEKLLHAYRLYLEHNLKLPANEVLARNAASLGAEGTWPDIDYADKSRGGWEPNQHLKRCREFWLAYTLAGRAELEEPARRSLAWWLAHKPEESQWWHREIGVPMQVRDILIAGGGHLTPEERAGAMTQLAQHQVKGVGANLVWSADLGLHHAALRGDEARVAELSAVLASEFRMAGKKEEGVQPDYSFHQHDERLQTFHYGGAYLAEGARLAWELRGTPWAFPPEKVDLLVNYVLEGCRWQMRGNQTVPSTMDRAFTRVNALKRGFGSTLDYLAELAPDRAADLRDLAASVKENRASVTGFRWFPYSDFGVWHSKEGSFFMKTLSIRTLTMESINEENLLRDQLNSGDQYLIRTGEEYFNLMPAWDWQRIPGVTWAEHAVKPAREPFSGGADNGASGLVSWHQRLLGPTDKDQLKVRKTTFIHEGTFLTLWSGLEATPGMGAVWTTVEQRRASDLPVYTRGNVETKTGPQTGNWHRINRQFSKEPVTEQVTLSWIDHDPKEGTGYYLVALGPVDEPGRQFRQLANTKSVQAVQWASGLVIAAFHEAAEVPGLKADRPCLVLSDGQRAWLADPLHKGGPARVSIAGGIFSAELPADGSTVESGK